MLTSTSNTTSSPKFPIHIRHTRIRVSSQTSQQLIFRHDHNQQKYMISMNFSNDRYQIMTKCEQPHQLLALFVTGQRANYLEKLEYVRKKQKQTKSNKYRSFFTSKPNTVFTCSNSTDSLCAYTPTWPPSVLVKIVKVIKALHKHLKTAKIARMTKTRIHLRTAANARKVGDQSAV